MGDKLLLNSGAKISALIYSFTCEITRREIFRYNKQVKNPRVYAYFVTHDIKM